MAKSYMKDAERHLEKIKYFHEHAGAYGYSPAAPHYFGLGDCYSKSAAKHLRRSDCPSGHVCRSWKAHGYHEEARTSEAR